MGGARALREIGRLSLVLVAGCGGSTERPVDAAQGCQLPPGRSYAQRVSIGGPGVGFDLDGDGAVDNAFGNLPPALLDQVNQDLQASFVTGNTALVLHIAAWTEPPAANDPDLAVSALLGVDADTSTQNNFDGTGKFVVDALSFDLNCDPAITMDQATLVNGTIHANARSLVVPFVGFQTVAYQGVQMEATFDADFMFFTFLNGGTLPFCSLAETKLSGDQSQSVLELFVNNEANTGVYPDIDLDGDGVERVITDGAHVTGCIDGDGVTSIPGTNCACDPRMKDGYSLSVHGDAAFVKVVGTR